MSERDRSTQIKVRKVTDLHANWNEEGEAEPGKFSFQLVLDNGAEEAVVRPPASDCKVLIKLLSTGKSVYFDTERRTLILNELE